MNIEIITTNQLSHTNLLELIINMGYNALISMCETEMDLHNVVKRKPDLLILTSKYIITQDEQRIWLSEFFTKNGINFSGSLKETLILASDKVFAKTYLKDKGINTPRYFTAVPGEYKRDFDIPIDYPLYLKTVSSHDDVSAESLALVKNYNEFQSKLLSLHNIHNAPVLVEEYLDGQEFSVSLIKTRDGEIFVSAIEILQASRDKEFTLIEDKILMEKVKNLAIDVFLDLDIRDFGQVHIRTNRSGHCFFIKTDLAFEIKNKNSYFFEAFTLDLGLSSDDVIKLIVDEGMSRV